MLQKPINFIHELSAIGRFLRKIAMKLEREVILEEKRLIQDLAAKAAEERPVLVIRWQCQNPCSELIKTEASDLQVEF